MSFNVFVIPEDFRKDQYILQPIIKKIMAQCGKPNANVRVCRDPLLGGVEQAMDRENLEAIIERYKGMVNLFLLCVDRDGKEGRRNALNSIESWAIQLVGANRQFFAVDAWQEIEVWVIAGYDLPVEWDWNELRSEIHPKERYFEPLSLANNMQDQPAEGRAAMAKVAASRYDRIRQLCPEDVGVLERRIQVWMNESNS